MLFPSDNAAVPIQDSAQYSNSRYYSGGHWRHSTLEQYDQIWAFADHGVPGLPEAALVVGRVPADRDQSFRQLHRDRSELRAPLLTGGGRDGSPLYSTVLHTNSRREVRTKYLSLLLQTRRREKEEASSSSPPSNRETVLQTTSTGQVRPNRLPPLPLRGMGGGQTGTPLKL